MVKKILAMLPEILYELEVRHTRTNPIFVIGNTRSGTSILCKMIRKYLKISFGTESQFIIRYYDRLPMYGDLEEDENLWLLIYDISQERCFSRWKRRFGFELDKESVYYDIKERTYQGVLEAFFIQLAKYHKMHRWGDKTPRYVLNLPVINELFSDAQFIHIVRDGRDVALSNLKTHFGNKNLYLEALNWKSNLLLIDEFLKTLPPQRYIEIKYEEFMADPVKTFYSLIQFLKIADENHELINFIGNHIMNDLYKNNSLKWKKFLTKKKVLTFDKLTSDVLKKYNYEVSTHEIWKPNFMIKLIWQLDNRIRKYLIKAYWSDNWYKLKLRGIIFPFKKFTHSLNSNKFVGNRKKGVMQEY